MKSLLCMYPAPGDDAAEDGMRQGYIIAFVAVGTEINAVVQPHGYTLERELLSFKLNEVRT